MLEPTPDALGAEPGTITACTESSFQVRTGDGLLEVTAWDNAGQAAISIGTKFDGIAAGSEAAIRGAG